MGADILAGRQDSEGKESFIVGGKAERWFLWWANLLKRKRSTYRGSGKNAEEEKTHSYLYFLSKKIVAKELLIL